MGNRGRQNENGLHMLKKTPLFSAIEGFGLPQPQRQVYDHHTSKLLAPPLISPTILPCNVVSRLVWGDSIVRSFAEIILTPLVRFGGP